MEDLLIFVKKLRPDAKLPFKNFEGDACFDLYAIDDYEIYPDQTVYKVHMGIAIEMPKGYEGVIRPRSSSFVKKNLQIHIGTIDQQYRGEIVAGVSTINTRKPVTIRKGEAVAQIAFREVPQFKIVEVEKLDETERGDGGFGSTG